MNTMRLLNSTHCPSFLPFLSSHHLLSSLHPTFSFILYPSFFPLCLLPFSHFIPLCRGMGAVNTATMFCLDFITTGCKERNIFCLGLYFVNDRSLLFFIYDKNIAYHDHFRMNGMKLNYMYIKI
jgi:hypothetical protein